MAQLFSYQPLTASTWNDFEKLVGARGACGGCWCMTWRLARQAFEKGKGDDNKKALKKLAANNETLGVLAFAGSEPVGWCAVAPRSVYARLQTSRALKPVDERPVWAVSCFFVAKPFRRTGLSVKLASAAVGYAKGLGARIVEAYPVEPKTGTLPDVFAWTGLVSTFTSAGFTEVARHSPSRPILRYYCS